MQSRQLTIYIGRLHRVRIHNRHPPHTCTAYHFGCISAYSAKTYNQHMRLLQPFHFLLSQQKPGSLFPILQHHQPLIINH
jgi:hypothetical protein